MTDDGHDGYILSPGAANRFLADLAVTPDVADPVGLLFDFLATKLPEEVILKSHKLNRDDLLRFFSTCTTTRNYLGAIAEDAVLVAQAWQQHGGLDMTTDDFWASVECRGPCGEIYQKFRAYMLRVPLRRQLQAFFEKQSLLDLFNVLLQPLFASDTPVRGGNKIEHRCLTLFVCVECAVAPASTDETTNKANAIRWLQGHGYPSLSDRATYLHLASTVCEEIIRMFPSLVSNLEKLDLPEPPAEFFVFTDMRDSSDPAEIERAENAKVEFVREFKRVASQDEHIHVNRDLNDEKTFYIPSEAAASEILKLLIRTYSAHDKYGRIGIVSSADTLKRAEHRENLPSSPINYMLAKKLGTSLKGATGDVAGHARNDLDLRHVGQQHGVLALGAASAKLLPTADFFGSGRLFTSLDEFLTSTEEGWVRVEDTEAAIDGGGVSKMAFTIYLYR